MSLSELFKGTSVAEWAREMTPLPVPPHPLPPDPWNKEIIHAKLLALGYDPFVSDPIRYPRSPPTVEEWDAHLRRLESANPYIEERTFDMDTESLVEAESPETACSNGVELCCASTRWWKISGLTHPIVLQRLPPPHPPFCLLCLRVQFADIIIKDRHDRELVHAPSSLIRPGPEPFVQKMLRPVQTFYNLRNMPGEYNGDFMMIGDTGDLLVLPMTRANLRFLMAKKDPTTQRFHLTQEALRYVQDPGAAIRPGETIQQLKERVRKRIPEEVIEWEEE
jgi:hypothetical protein